MSAKTMRDHRMQNAINAERYCWLRDHSAGQWKYPIVVSQQKQGDRMLYIGPLFGAELDAVIDAARRAK